MKKLLVILWIVSSISLFGARNEDEEGLPPDVTPRNENRSSSHQQPDEQNNNRTQDNSYQPPVEQNRPAENSPAREPEANERRAFSEILNRLENRRQTNRQEDIPIRWSNNSERRPSRSQAQNNRQAVLKTRLTLSHRDILIVPGTGYIDLIIRKKAAIHSVLLTTASNSFRANASPYSEYVLRSMKWIPENGDERLLYKKRLIGKNAKLYFLVTSSVIRHPAMGKAFRMRVPNYVIYGYKWENFGTLKIQDGSRFNIRTFSKKYADYRGGFADNVITMDSRLYSGRDFFPPVMRIYKLAETNEYVVAYIEYKDNEKFFKSFSIRDGNNPFVEIVFSRIDEVRDMRAVLISSEYDIIRKKVVRMKVYLEKMQSVRTITVTGEDPSGNQPVKPVVFKIPVKGQGLQTVIEPAQENRPETENRTGTTPRTQEDNTPPPMN